MKKAAILLPAILILITFQMQQVVQATAPVFYQGTAVNTSGYYSLTGFTGTLLPQIATWIAGFLGAIAILFLIWAGIQFLTAEGDAEKITQATKTAFYVIVGVLLVVFAYALVYLFLTIFTPSP